MSSRTGPSAGPPRAEPGRPRAGSSSAAGRSAREGLPAARPGRYARAVLLARALRVLVAATLVGAGVPGVLGVFGAWSWWLDLCAHFRVQYAGALLLALALAAGLRRWRLLAVGAPLLALNLVVLAPLAVPEDRSTTGPPLPLAHFNLLTSNRRHADVRAWISASGAELVLLQEVDRAWAAALADVPGYRLIHALPRADNFGLALLLREGAAPPLAVDVLDLAGLPALALRLRHAGRPLALLGLHTLPPVSARNAALRDAQLAAAAAWARAQRDAGAAPVLLGDFNATPFSAALAPLAAVGLRDSLEAGGLLVAGSWPDLPWPLRIAIDHCWHDPRLVTQARALGPALGSDHRPLRVDLAWAE